MDCALESRCDERLASLRCAPLKWASADVLELWCLRRSGYASLQQATRSCISILQTELSPSSWHLSLSCLVCAGLSGLTSLNMYSPVSNWSDVACVRFERAWSALARLTSLRRLNVCGWHFSTSTAWALTQLTDLEVRCSLCAHAVLQQSCPTGSVCEAGGLRSSRQGRAGPGHERVPERISLCGKRSAVEHC